MGQYVLSFQQIGREQVALVGGKGASLGELSRIEGVRVPPGFCITTDAYQRIISEAPANSSIHNMLDRLARLKPDDHEAIHAQSAQIRRMIEGTEIPEDLATAISECLAQLRQSQPGAGTAYAVRSSATAEDLPTASFAGQHDSYLNVVGTVAILKHVSRCWASLFTDRAVSYRLKHRLDHRKVQMAVVVQRMIIPHAGGVLFTAEPVTGDRKLAVVEAGYRLAESVVSGLVHADVYKVRDDEIVAKIIATKEIAIVASDFGGIHGQAIASGLQKQQALSDQQVVRLVQLGRQIEAYFACPQDIEWCFSGNDFAIVQSRPITTLFPIPQQNDQENRVYVSVGHQQMMTDPLKPLGLSVWQLTTPRPMAEAGGRLFVDVTQSLASTASRANLLGTLEKSDPLIRDALDTVLERGFIQSVSDAEPAWVPPGAGSDALATDPAIVADLIARTEDALARLKRDIQNESGSALLDIIVAHIQGHRRSEFHPRSMQAIMAGMEAAWWLNEKMQEWLGEKNAADTLTQSVPNNVTSEMGLALIEVADAIRPHPDVIASLQDVSDEGFLNELPNRAGGLQARDAIRGWLDRYGMRCPGEIDITRPRWSERPSMLLPLILGNVRTFSPGAATQRFEQGRQEARKKEEELLARLRRLPDGEQKAEETKRMIDRVRTFAGYREYPKYAMVSRYFVYKQALMGEAERLVRAGVLREREDIFYLRIQELQDVVRSDELDYGLIDQRKEEFNSYQSLTPPRVLTSEGEGISGAYRRENLPAGALVGIAVSAGTVEGRARVILDMAKADLVPGDILVTRFTDPSWTPLFVSITGLVTEVGGLMTHGAVIAREYGLPAVVGVANATLLIRDGQRIRVHGTEGFVEILNHISHE